MKPVTLAFLLILSVLSSDAQINAYASVSAISSTTLTLSSINQSYHTFAAGEQIIVMQMQDAVVGSNTSNSSSYGTLTTIASAGSYEVATIASVSGLPGSLTITSALSRTYNIGTGSSVQVISFNKYGSPDYTTTSAITALAWNGKIGGVVAMQVAGTLTLAYSITADAAGFRGGAVSSNYESGCEPTVYASSSSNYAYKGEGIQVNNTGFLYGRNPLANGGGGGSDDNAGGGGGSNYSAGGQGGAGWTCSANPSGGFSGNSLSTYVNVNRVFMGGGGGGGQQNNSVGTAGANGGGIIIIKANALATSCSGSITISASGGAGTTSGNDGAGGGGGGGSIVMSIGSFSVPASCPLNVTGNGGNGGSVGNSGAHGGGGGGGQGVILYPATVPSNNITNVTNAGTGGANNNTNSSYAGGGGGTSSSGVLANNGYIALPVRIVNFTGRLNEGAAALSWQAPEANSNDLFEIQRRTGNGNFTPIGEVSAEAFGLSYSFVDNAPDSGYNFYRLKAIDDNGNAIYSSIIEIRVSSDEAQFSVYPNPIIDAFTLKMASAQNAAVTVTLTDLSGRPVFMKTGYSNGGLMAVSLDHRPTAGIYLLTVNTSQKRASVKVLVK